MTKDEKSFIQGFAVLAAFICEQGGSVNFCSMFNEHGYFWDDFLKAQVSQYDLDRIKKSLSEDELIRIGYKK